jgi:hypothetical protein
MNQFLADLGYDYIPQPEVNTNYGHNPDDQYPLHSEPVAHAPIYPSNPRVEVESHLPYRQQSVEPYFEPNNNNRNIVNHSYSSPNSVSHIPSEIFHDERFYVNSMLDRVRQSLLLDDDSMLYNTQQPYHHPENQRNQRNPQSEPHLSLGDLLPVRQDPIRERKERWQKDWEAKNSVPISSANISRDPINNDGFSGMSLAEVLMPPPPRRVAPCSPTNAACYNEEPNPLPPLRQAPELFDEWSPQTPQRRTRNNLNNPINTTAIDFSELSLSQVLPPRSTTQPNHSNSSNQHWSNHSDRNESDSRLTHSRRPSSLPSLLEIDANQSSPAPRRVNHRRNMTDRELAEANGFSGGLSDIMPLVDPYQNPARRRQTSPEQRRRNNHRRRTQQLAHEQAQDQLNQRVVEYGGSGGGGGWQPSSGDYMAENEMSYERLLSLDQNNQKPNRKRGGDVIRKAMKNIKFHASKHGEDPCVICLEMFKPGEGLVQIRNCRCTKASLYHDRCLRQWLKADSSCPHCRANALEGII